MLSKEQRRKNRDRRDRTSVVPWFDRPPSSRLRDNPEVPALNEALPSGSLRSLRAPRLRGAPVLAPSGAARSAAKSRWTRPESNRQPPGCKPGVLPLNYGPLLRSSAFWVSWSYGGQAPPLLIRLRRNSELRFALRSASSKARRRGGQASLSTPADLPYEAPP